MLDGWGLGRRQTGHKPGIKENCEQSAGGCQGDAVEKGLWAERSED